MRPTLILCFSLLTLINTAMGQHKIGIFDNHTDIGDCKNQGFANYNVQHQTYTIGGAGANMWADDDQFHYLWTTLQGDFILRAEIAFLGAGVDPHRKAGWIIKNNLDSNTETLNASTHGDGLTALQYRKKVGGETAHTISKDSFPDVIQLERRGNTYIWQSLGSNGSGHGTSKNII